MHRLISDSDPKAMMRNFDHLSSNWLIPDETTKNAYLLTEDKENSAVLLNKYETAGAKKNQLNSKPAKTFKIPEVLLDSSDPSYLDIVDAPANVDASKFLFYCIKHDSDGKKATQNEILFAALASSSDQNDTVAEDVELVSKSFHPHFELNVSFGDVKISFGKIVDSSLMSSAPSVIFNPTNRSQPITEQCTYSVLLVDVGADQSSAYVHWAVTNMDIGDASSGEEVQK